MLSNMTLRTLIHDGLVLDTEAGTARSADVLIEDGRVIAVDQQIEADAERIDAGNCLVLPGFVDTHRHVWQSLLQSLLPDTMLGPYLGVLYERVIPRYRPADVRLASLAGALQCLDAGITSVVDFANLQPTPEHTDAGIDGLLESGIRGVYGYGSTGSVAELRRVADRLAGTPLRLALAVLGPEHGSPEDLDRDWSMAAEIGCPITMHVGGYGPDSAKRGLDLLRDKGMLRPGTIYAHANYYPDDDLRLLGETGGAVAASPIVEAMMDHGAAATGRAYRAGVPVGLGADAVTSGPGDMFSLMRATYGGERLQDKDFGVRDVVRIATVGGARTAGLDDVAGSLSPGKQADVVLLRTDRLGIAPAHDPFASVVLSADTAAVDTVLVAGRVVKRDGQLVGHDVPALISQMRESAARIAAA